MTTRVVHLTDTHLFRDPAQRLNDVPTQATLVDVLDHVRSHVGNVDHLVLTGDFAHDEARETYDALGVLLGDLRSRSELIPGNHDDPAYLRAAFPDRIDQSTAGPVAFSIAAGDWRLIGLDSHIAHDVRGRIEGAQLAWLRSELEHHADAPTVIFVHHPPVPIHSAGLNGWSMYDPEPLLELVHRNRQVKIISCGHVHREFEAEVGHVRFVTTPSTAFQFKQQVELELDALAPGYRVFHLERDEWHTEVVRLPELRYPATRDKAPTSG